MIPKSERKHIVFIGTRNAGKSSLVNRFANQEISIVSNTPGTTTDPVRKSMELLPFGPIVIVDTAGFDDLGDLGLLRVNKTSKAVASADFVIFVLDATRELSKIEEDYIEQLIEKNVSFLFVVNKIDLGLNKGLEQELKFYNKQVLFTSATENEGIEELRNITALVIPDETNVPLVGDLIKQGDIVVLVTPIDLGAPKGRLILPQVTTIRESLDEDAVVIICKEKELRRTLSMLNEKPKLVITDSQVIMKVAADVPNDIKLTTFSILMARYKGDLDAFIRGIKAIDSLDNGDKVLVAEACSHHTQEDDIGRVKIPRWLRNYTKKNIQIDHAQGKDFPDELAEYKLIIHCGGCMITRKEMNTRIKQSVFYSIPIVNYGLIISYMHGAIPRALEPFGISQKEEY